MPLRTLRYLPYERADSVNSVFSVNAMDCVDAVYLAIMPFTLLTVLCLPYVMSLMSPRILWMPCIWPSCHLLYLPYFMDVWMSCIGESDVWYGMYVWNGIIPYVCMVWYGMYGMSTGGFAAPDRSTERVFRKSALEDLLKS